MSLFKVCDWWKTQCPDLEPRYDSFSLHCTRLCIEEDEKDSIVVGSHNGYLGIYQPSGGSFTDLELTEEDRNFENAFQHSSVILEVKLPHPVLGLATGKFTTASKTDNRRHLAVLHPRKLCVFQILTVDGLADHGDHTRLALLYEHQLTGAAFSLCRGNFGGVKGRDFLCVQHLDGTLRFFEQDGISFERTIGNGNRNIPSPLQYVSRIDCFVTVAPNWELECYRYQDISETADNLRRHDPIWSLCIGEYALDLCVQQISNNESVVVVLGENNLLCITDTGKVRFIKKLDYAPICFHAFVIGWYWEPNARLMIAVVSESGSLLLYENDQIVWSAQLAHVPVALCRANVSGLPGALVTLGETGVLTVGFLGSEPHLFKVPPLNLAPFDIERCQRELGELEREIRSGVDFSDAAIANAAAERDVALQVVIDPQREHCTHQTNIRTTQPTEMCQLTVTANVRIPLELLQISVATDPAIRCSKPTFMFRDVASGSSEQLKVWVYPCEAAVPGSLLVTVSCSYTNKQGITRVLQRAVNLPLALLVKPCPASKETKHKITLVVHGATIADGLHTLLPEFVYESSSNAVGLQSLTNTDSRVTIVAAKSSNRLRIQSEDLLMMPLVLQCIIDRLTDVQDAHVAKSSGSKVTVTTLPSVAELLKHFYSHHQLRQELKALENTLESTTGQMRLFERRFVVKLQERSLRALDGILMLLRTNHADVAKTSSQISLMQRKLQLSQIHLSALLQLFRTCYTHSSLPVKQAETLGALLAGPVCDSSEQSWAEMLLPAIRFLDQSGPLRCPTGSTEAANYDEMLLFANDDPGTFDHELFEKSLRRLLGRVATLDNRPTRGSGSGRSSVDFDEPPPVPEEEEDEENRKATATGNDDDDDDEASEWVGSEKSSADLLHLPML